MARPHEFTPKEREMHGRCLNWGRAMSGHVVNLDLRVSSGEGQEPNTVDAEMIEIGIIRMRGEKHLHYWLVRYIYLGRRSTIEASNFFKKSEWWVRTRQREALAYLLRKTEDKVLQLSE